MAKAGMTEVRLVKLSTLDGCYPNPLDYGSVVAVPVKFGCITAPGLGNVLIIVFNIG